LEALELANFHEFNAWCTAERELVNRAQAQLLSEIIHRTMDEPETALPHARALVSLDPYSESARETLIVLLVKLGHTAEARQQYELGARMLAEAGAKPTGALTRALQSGAQRQPAAEPPTSLGDGPLQRARATAAAKRETQSAHIVGRQAELAQIALTLDTAIRLSQAHFVLLRGDPGIGKSHLLLAARRMAEQAGAWVLESSAWESESIRPFAVWIDGLRRVAPESAAAIFAARDGENRERLLGGLSDLITERCREQPVVLLLDDLQWCDDSSATALHYLARTNRHYPILGILATRETDLQDNAALLQALNGLRHAGMLTEICLEPMSEPEIRKLVEIYAPGIEGASLSRECGGNPLIAVELARAEAAGDSGGSLRELIRERLARLDIESSEILQWAAVLAPRIELGMLERVTQSSPDAISKAFELAERQGMLQPTDLGYRFSHDLIARNIYNHISPARRRMMHRKVSELLEQQTAVELEHAADLAHHASQSGDAGLAARAMVSAARLCLRFFANDEARSLAQRGLGLVEKLPEGERVCLTIDFEDILMVAAPVEDWETVVEDIIELAERALDHGAMSHARRAYYMASYLRWTHGNWAAARNEALQAERVSRSGSDEDHVVGMAEAAHCLALLERDLTHADAMLMEAQALAARNRIAHHSIPAGLGILRYHENQFDSAIEYLQEARALAKRAGDRISEYQSNEHLVMIDIERGEYRAARRGCSTLIEIGEKLRSGSEGPFARALDALCEYAIGGEDTVIDAAVEDLRGVDAKHRLAYVLTRAAMIDLDRQDFAAALTRAGEALENASILERATDMLLAHVVIAKAHKALGDVEAFEQHAASVAGLTRGSVAAWARIRAEEELS
ncbi:MAG: AAA family ATPase, partial [Gammaproteobacteria bacterium]